LALTDFLAGLTLALAALPLGGQGLGFLPGAPVRDRVTLHGNVHPAVRDLMPEGRTDPGLAMDRMIMSLRLRPDAKAQLEHLLLDLQDPGSPRYHQWLTPEQFRAAFGPSPGELAQVTGWLEAQGFRVDEVARGGMSLTFSGDAAQVEGAFRTPILEYRVEGRKRHANAADPSIPAGLAPLVDGIVSLHDIPRAAANTGLRPVPSAAPTGASSPLFTSTQGHFLAPDDFATIYNVSQLYSRGITGAGVTVAIVGRTHPAETNWQTFRSQFGLPNNPPVFVLNGPDPGGADSNENTEANLDVEWSGAVARNATIQFVCSKSTTTTDGVDLSAQFIVNQNAAAVMSTSFGSCESAMSAAENLFYSNLWAQAAAQGISSFVSSGDSGAAGCDAANLNTGTVRAVNGLASTVYNICVGGTEFNEGAGAFWSPGNSATSSSALGYIPEVVWNESASAPGGQQLWSTGGGVSARYAKPTWQVAPGVPNDGFRDVPDVSLTAAGHDGYLIISQAALGAVAGTSAASPAFAGLMALIVQQTGQRQGNANPTFYQLGNAQFNGGTAIFHDILAGDNSVPGVSGFSAGAGYDRATGLGSVDAFALVGNWAGSITPRLSSAGLLTGRTATFNVTLSTPNFNPAVHWSATGGTVVAGNPATGASFHAGAAGTYTLTATAPDIPPRSTTISVKVQDPHLLGTGAAVTGLDLLYLLSRYGASGADADLNGDGVVDQLDRALLLTLLGWTNP